MSLETKKGTSKNLFKKPKTNSKPLITTKGMFKKQKTESYKELTVGRKQAGKTWSTISQNMSTKEKKSPVRI